MRDVATKGRYGDVDQNAAHQAHLIILCRAKQVPVPRVLEEYVQNKQEIREREAAKCQVSTDAFKTAISAATYGKKFQTFDFQLKESDWLERYAAAMQDLAPRLVNEQSLRLRQLRSHKPCPNLTIQTYQLLKSRNWYHTGKFCIFWPQSRWINY